EKAPLHRHRGDLPREVEQVADESAGQGQGNASAGQVVHGSPRESVGLGRSKLGSIGRRATKLQRIAPTASSSCCVPGQACGIASTGVAADLLPPKWFTKDPARAIDDEVDEMLRVIEHAVVAATGLEADSPFDAWRALWAIQDRWGREQGLPPLLTHFGTSLV